MCVRFFLKKEMRLIIGDGSVLELSDSKNSDTFHAACVSVGSMGIISTVTIECVPRFTLRRVCVCLFLNCCCFF